MGPELQSGQAVSASVEPFWLAPMDAMGLC